MKRYFLLFLPIIGILSVFLSSVPCLAGEGIGHAPCLPPEDFHRMMHELYRAKDIENFAIGLNASSWHSEYGEELDIFSVRMSLMHNKRVHCYLNSPISFYRDDDFVNEIFSKSGSIFVKMDGLDRFPINPPPSWMGGEITNRELYLLLKDPEFFAKSRFFHTGVEWAREQIYDFFGPALNEIYGIRPVSGGAAIMGTRPVGRVSRGFTKLSRLSGLPPKNRAFLPPSMAVATSVGAAGIEVIGQMLVSHGATTTQQMVGLVLSQQTLAASLLTNMTNQSYWETLNAVPQAYASMRSSQARDLAGMIGTPRDTDACGLPVMYAGAIGPDCVIGDEATFAAFQQQGLYAGMRFVPYSSPEHPLYTPPMPPLPEGATGSPWFMPWPLGGGQWGTLVNPLTGYRYR